MAVATSAPPESNAWSKGPPALIKKVRSLKKVTIADIGHKRNLSVNLNAPLKTPTSAESLAVPMSAMSLWTESDPATPFDPMTHRKKMLEIEKEAKENGHSKAISKSSLGNLASDSSPAPCQVFDPSESFLPFMARAYPWGMPMSPISLGAYHDSLASDVEGGLGVIWTPAGWAVQDAAMKHALRSAEVQLKFENVKRRKPKSYYRSMSQHPMSFSLTDLMYSLHSSSLQVLCRRTLSPRKGMHLHSYHSRFVSRIAFVIRQRCSQQQV